MVKLLTHILLGLLALASLQTASSETIKVGVVANLSGELNAVGTDFVRAAQMAADDHNKKSEHKIELIVEDDAFSQAKGLSAIKKLLDVDGVQAIVNMTTPTINSAYNLLLQRNIPTAQLGLFELSDKVDNIFMLQGSYEPAIAKLAKFVSEQAGDEPTELYYFEDPSVLHYVKHFEQGFGKKLVKTALPTQLTDISSAVTKTIGQKTKHVVFGLMPDSGSEVIKKFKQLNYPVEFYSLWSLEIGQDTYISKLGKDSPSYLNTYFITTAESIDPVFMKRFEELHKSKIQSWAEGGYDCMKLIAESYNSDVKTWINNMQNFSGRGVGGPIKFDAAGIRVSDFKIMQIKDMLSK
jgi:ABC-type branched-subunit amino acid transport system substrate-binding protein